MDRRKIEVIDIAIIKQLYQPTHIYKYANSIWPPVYFNGQAVTYNANGNNHFINIVAALLHMDCRYLLEGCSCLSEKNTQGQKTLPFAPLL